MAVFSVDRCGTISWLGAENPASSRDTRCQSGPEGTEGVAAGVPSDPFRLTEEEGQCAGGWKGGQEKQRIAPSPHLTETAGQQAVLSRKKGLWLPPVPQSWSRAQGRELVKRTGHCLKEQDRLLESGRLGFES